MDNLIRVHLFVSGLVQGVFYRYNTQRVARVLSLTGWVRNLADSRVEIVVEGKRREIKKLIEWAQKGSPWSKVEKIEVYKEKYQGEFKNFEIKY